MFYDRAKVEKNSNNQNLAVIFLTSDTN